jgi:fructose-bisphosphate aldolase class II
VGAVTAIGLTGLLWEAAEVGRGVGAFNVFSLEHAEALVAGAAEAGTAVVLQISQNAVRYHRSLAPITLATLALARASDVRAVVHLDHATDVDLVHEAVDLGVGSVMFDGSELDYDDNVRVTAEVTAHCHARGVDVEAELGEVGGKDGVHAAGARTRPDEAAAFVAATGVDALAVAVGSSHAMTERRAALDLELIKELRAAVEVPLVLHGSSGVPDHEIVRAVRAGITKINIATHLNKIFTGAVRSVLGEHPMLVDSRKYLGPARDAMAAETARLLTMLDGASVA